jgi:hypothetical protein
VSAALQLVNMLSAIGARTAPGGESELGAGIAGGELPHAQVLRSTTLFSSPHERTCC